MTLRPGTLNRILLRPIVLGIAALALSGAGAPLQTGTARAEDDRCYGNWTEAAPVVRRERLATIRQLDKLARSRTGASIVGSRLCQSRDGRYYYKLVVRTPKGVISALKVDARHPFQGER